MEAFLSIASDILLPRFYLLGTAIHLTCREFYTKSLQNNLSRMFCSFSPSKCYSTAILRNAYPKIDSKIPYLYQAQVCVLARVSKQPGENTNDVCILGNTSKVIHYLLSFLSTGISFQSLEIFAKGSFHSSRRGRNQSINLGYGKRINLNATNLVNLS
jgi:hypothetical protein